MVLHSRFSWACSGFAALALVGPASAAIINPSFEAQAAALTAGAGYTVDDVTNYVAGGAVGAYRSPFPAYDGLVVVYGQQGDTFNYIYQDLTDNYAANTTYTFSLFQEQSPTGSASSFQISLRDPSNLTEFAFSPVTTASTTGWTQTSVSLTTGSSDVFLGNTIRVAVDFYGAQTEIDSLHLAVVPTSSVPEPASFGVLTAGAACLGLLRRRNRN